VEIPSEVIPARSLIVKTLGVARKRLSIYLEILKQILHKNQITFGWYPETARNWKRGNIHINLIEQQYYLVIPPKQEGFHHLLISGEA